MAAADPVLPELLETARRLLAQQRRDSNKLYSVHAPEVKCLAKGKAHKRYEFGCKASFATPSKGNWVAVAAGYNFAKLLAGFSCVWRKLREIYLRGRSICVLRSPVLLAA